MKEEDKQSYLNGMHFLHRRRLLVVLQFLLARLFGTCVCVHSIISTCSCRLAVDVAFCTFMRALESGCLACRCVCVSVKNSTDTDEHTPISVLLHTHFHANKYVWIRISIPIVTALCIAPYSTNMKGMKNWSQAALAAAMATTTTAITTIWTWTGKGMSQRVKIYSLDSFGTN